MKKICLVLGMVAMFGLCYAPIEDRPPGGKFYRELNDQELSQVQSGTTVPAPYGDSTESKPEAPLIRNDATASDTVSTALSGKANVALAQADKDAKSKAGGGPRFLIWGAIVAALGLGSVFAVRTYANKVVPEPMSGRNVRW